MNQLILRQWHTYIGVFIAPSVLFFAITGALQVFDLHEPHGDYRPAPIIQELGQLHKKQVLTVRRPSRPEGASPSRGPGRPGPGEQKPPQRLSTVLLKCFFELVALGLAASTLLGVCIGLSHARRKKVSWSLLVAGAVLPLALLAF